MSCAQRGSHLVYRGPSRLTGAPVLAVLTGLGSGGSRNTKTGAGMGQLWILDATEEPHLAQRTGCDESVCGSCPLRPSLHAQHPTATYKCYVRTHEAPLSVYRAHARGSYSGTNLATACAALWDSGLPVRLGAYGDPAALPPSVVAALTSCSQGWSGYTHQWRAPTAQHLRHVCMASCGDAESLCEASSLGWRAFIAYSGRAPHWPLWTKQTVTPCPAARGTTCDRCRLCSGVGGRGRGHVSIASHR